MDSILWILFLTKPLRGIGCLQVIKFDCSCCDAARIVVLRRIQMQVHTVSHVSLRGVNQQGADLREASGRINAELKAERDSHAKLRGEWTSEKSNRELAEVQVNKFTTEIAKLNSSLNAERSQAAEKLAMLLEAKEAL